jgi:hypothetical protein
VLACVLLLAARGGAVNDSIFPRTSEVEPVCVWQAVR